MIKFKQMLIGVTVLVLFSGLGFAEESLDGRGQIYSPEVELPKGREAGFVITTNGKLTALSESGKVRTLTRRSQFYANETLRTGDKSTAQLRFKDHALMTLKPNTQLRISDYHFGGAKDPENKSFMELLSGGFRTLSGSIGKLNQSAYRIDTPAASIGIRGTDYEIVIAVGGKVFAVVHGGAIALVNDIGELDIGEGSEFAYAEISPGQAPIGLDVLPDLFVKVGSGNDRPLTQEEKAALVDRMEEVSHDADLLSVETDAKGGSAIDFSTFVDSTVQSGAFDDAVIEDPCLADPQCGY